MVILGGWVFLMSEVPMYITDRRGKWRLGHEPEVQTRDLFNDIQHLGFRRGNVTVFHRDLRKRTDALSLLNMKDWRTNQIFVNQTIRGHFRYPMIRK